jgi:hypothetical protein
MGNVFKFPNLFFHCHQICGFLYTFKKNMFAIYFQKIDVALLPSIIYFCPIIRDIHVAHNFSVIYILHRTLRFIYKSTPFSTFCFLTYFAGTTLPHNLVFQSIYMLVLFSKKMLFSNTSNSHKL